MAKYAMYWDIKRLTDCDSVKEFADIAKVPPRQLRRWYEQDGLAGIMDEIKYVNEQMRSE